MELEPAEKKLRALVLVNDPQQAARITHTLAQRGIPAKIEIDPEAALRECRSHAPDLVIVEDRLSGMAGMSFLAGMLKISWTTAAILICDEEEDAVHERTEGLGILGNIKGFDDMDGLERLLDRFFEVLSCDKSPIRDQKGLLSPDEVKPIFETGRQRIPD